MVEHGDIVLCFLSDEESEIQLALDYWSINSEGRWTMTVQAIADRLGRRKHKIPELVSRVATAYNVTIRCEECDAPKAITSRSDFIGYGAWQASAVYLCADCRAARLEAARIKQVEQERRQTERLRDALDEIINKQKLFDYSEIRYLDAIVAYGIMQWSETAVANGIVGNVFQLELCSGEDLLSDLLGRLFKSGVLVVGKDTPLDAFTSDAKGCYPLRVRWQFAAPLGGSSYADVFRILGATLDSKTDHLEYSDAVSELWGLLAADDALHYLRQQLERYRLFEFVAGEKMNEAVAYATNRFSIPNVRYLLYRIAKNTAALSSRQDFTRRHALNTIPGSLIRDCDRALADNWTIKGFCAKWDEEEPRLITLLFDRVLGTGIEGFRVMNGHMLEQVAA